MEQPNKECKDCGGSAHFGGLIHHVSHELRRGLDTRIAADVTPELTGARGMLLGDVVRANRENRPVYQRDVEQWYHIRRSSVTAMLQGMEQDGFIIRRPVAQDARLKSLYATPKGQAYFDRILKCIASFEEDLAKGIDAEALAGTKQTLCRLLTNLKAAQEETKGNGGA